MPTILRGYIRESRAVLKNMLCNLMPEPGSYATPIKGLSIHRFDLDEPPRLAVYTPTLEVIAQGRERVRVGAEEFVYGPHTCFVAGVSLSAFSRILGATPESPHLALTMDLDHELITRLTSLPLFTSKDMQPPPLSARVQDIDDAMLDNFVRLLLLLYRPEQIPVLAPIFQEEIHCRLLLGPFERTHHLCPIHY